MRSFYVLNSMTLRTYVLMIFKLTEEHLNLEIWVPTNLY